MRHLNGIYTQRYNRKYKKDGPLFRGRYKAVLIQADNYLAQVKKCVHKSPSKSRTVKDLRNYKWSSNIFDLSKGTDKKRMDINNILANFVDKEKDSINAYRKFMDVELEDDVLKFYSKKKKKIKPRY